eukprot:m.169207 g.169207  ORF g.169207 m.169207 type:complete len:472 (-) comp17235_c1_seq3:2766-4181(-)
MASELRNHLRDSDDDDDVHDDDGNDLVSEALPALEGWTCTCPLSAPKQPYICPCCDMLHAELDATLKHLMQAHHVVVGEVDALANVHKYFEHWHERLKHAPIESLVTKITTAPVTGPVDALGRQMRHSSIGSSTATATQPSASAEAANTSNNEYYFMCDVVPEDKALREALQTERLKKILDCQRNEKLCSQNANWRCLFCKEQSQGDRFVIFRHMLAAHGFNIGLPDNMVHVHEFLSTLQAAIVNLQCLYCEKTFRDRTLLKSHMRKKKHYKIDPRNTTYDRFYVINYAEAGRSWKELEQDAMQDSVSGQSDEENTWDDWNDEGEASTKCLFCPSACPSPAACFAHMKDAHDFDFWQLVDTWQLTFYHRIKLVNFVRHQLEQKKCPQCDASSGTSEELLAHMKENNHFSVRRDAAFWEQAEYFFPIMENDALLCALEDEGEIAEPDTPAVAPSGANAGANASAALLAELSD